MEEVKLRHHIENDDSSTYFIDDVESERVLSPGAGLWATLKGVICHDEASAQLCHFVMGLLTVAAFVFGVLLMFSWTRRLYLDVISAGAEVGGERMKLVLMRLRDGGRGWQQGDG